MLLSASARNWENSFGFMAASRALLVEGSDVANSRKAFEHAIRGDTVGGAESTELLARGSGP